MRMIRCSLASALLAAAVLSAPRFDRWEVIGPGGGGAQFLPAISPHDPRRVLVACDMTGAYISDDAGGSWRMFNLRGRVRFFVFDPVEQDTLYVKTIGLWRSVDGAKTWRLVHPDPAIVSGVTMPDDHAAGRILTTQPAGGSIEGLAIDPRDSKTLYAVFSENRVSSVRVSTDWGKTWQEDAELPEGGRRIYVDPRSREKARTLYVIGNRSVAVREEGRWRTGQAAPGVTRFGDASLGFARGSAKPVIYAIGSGNVFVSADGGATWTQSPLPGDSVQLRAVATSLDHPEVAYLSYTQLRIGDQRFFGVAKTGDTGGTWELVWKESRRSAANIHDSWISERFGPGWGESPFNLGVGPHDPNLCYGSDWGRTMRTVDGGRTWEAVYSRRLPDGSHTTNGLDVTTTYGVHFDPFDAKRLFISYTDIGLFRSENGGEGWVSSTAGVPRAWVNTTYWVEFDPEVRGRAWAAMSETHDLPRPKMWRDASPATYQGGVTRSDDGGRTWRVSNRGMPPTAVTHVLLDRTSPPGARVLYAAGFGRGVFKSVDDGTTWTLKNNGIEGNEPFAWRLSRAPDGTLYLVVARKSEDGSIGDARDGALYRSSDAAEHWQRIKLPGGVNGPNGLAIDPQDPRRLYLSAWGRETRSGAAGGGVFLSTDAGATWRNILDHDQHIYDVTLDPRDPRILYACGFESSAWRSTDRGATWQRIRGFNFKWGHRVIPDPRDPERIYITTFGGSVWHGPATGDPRAVEDIVTPALAYTRPE